ncbi:MAG: DUF58 domain-containing protein [Oscillospiraceae bacterium]|nr:DUF58 domain-containing protein [Oscillospiraceae bacterium]
MKLRPTGKLIVFIVVLVLCLLPATLVNGLAGYFPFLLLLLSGVLAFLQLLLIKNGLTIETVTGQERCVRGDEVQFTIVIRNRSILPVPRLRALFYLAGLDGEDSQTLPLEVTLSPRETREFGFGAAFTHIGVYRAGVREMTVYDLFGLFRARRTEEEQFQVEIQPRVYTLARLPVSSNLAAESSRAITAVQVSGMDYIGVREYAYGDPLKAIQWKISAHTGTIMVKQTESHTNTGMTVVLDCRAPAGEEETRLSLFDGIVESAVAAGQYAARNGMDYDLMFYTRDGEKRRIAPSSFRALGHSTAQIRLLPEDEKGVSVARLLREDCGSVHGQTNVVLCTARLDEEIISALLFLKQNRKNPIVYYLIPEHVYDRDRQELLKPLKRLQQAQISCVVAASAEALEVG